MPLPVTFASLTTITSSFWDQNFSALGALVAIPCTVTGTNALTLAPLTNTPTVGSYQNYMQFTGIAVASNSGAVTAQVGGLGALNVYVDTPAGPVALTSGNIIINTAFTLMYDSTLNTGAGGFHLNSAIVAGGYLPLVGGALTGAVTGTAISLSGPLLANSATITTRLTSPTISGVTTLAATNISGSGVSSTTSTVSGLATAGKLAVAGGQTLTRMLTSSIVFAGSTIAAQGQTAGGATIAGVSVGDVVLVSWPYDLTTIGLAFNAGVVASTSVVAKVFNYSAASIAFTGGTCNVVVLGYT